ncbi:uncharacterized protein BDR25DRAFT_342887 [Lindgomyces ingoldianus]|uniref:Uncharacterized protein n=1 Tax=Lindgomyces ingoldianus TaxID=673940 RepID=A0ACB6QU69_9PLEO|nr:uncharacterized protein BDR25DRAFT_342887 [Lindgomyces ingoldianus]KAF2470559.1 hypothetical protein BDR25DRAFT_342887 [Lindgomyces ingoldianus]
MVSTCFTSPGQRPFCTEVLEGPIDISTSNNAFEISTTSMHVVGGTPTPSFGDNPGPEAPVTSQFGIETINPGTTAVFTISSATDSAVLASQTGAGNSVPAATVSRKSNGVSKGAVAGIAIGTAIVGAAIAFLVAFLLFKRRNRSRQHSGYDAHPELVSLAKAGPDSHVQEMSQAPLPHGAAAAAVGISKRDTDLTDLSHSSDFSAGVLPQAADDRTVKEKASLLFDQVQLHVENFYRDVHASITPSMESGLSRFGTGTENTAEMLQDSSRPTVVIKHALMAYVLSITSPFGGSDTALFPRDVAGIQGGEQFKRTPDLSAAYILYKRLATHLHTASPPNPSRQSDIREAAEHFSLTFFPWVNPRYGDQEKDEHLVQVISNALDLNIWLYGQPFIYQFLWEGVGHRGVVVAPGLTKESDAKGVVGRPQMLLEPVVVPT